MSATRILLASPPEPSGASWLVNCLLELGIQVRYKPVVDRVWRNAQPRPSPDRMWRTSGGRHTLDERAVELKKWLPALSRVPEFAFREGVVVDYVQDLAPAEPEERRTLLFVRDPRDAIHSMYQRARPRLTFEEFVAFRDPETLLDRIDQWSLRVRGWCALPAVCVFRFEDYKRDADDTLARVLDWLKLPIAPAERARTVAESTYEKARAAEARYRAQYPHDTEVANRAGRVGEWSEARLDSFAAEVERRAAPALERCGYACAPGRGDEGFLGAAPLRWLAIHERIRVPEGLDALAADPPACERSLADLRAFAVRLDEDFLARSALAPFEIRALLDNLGTLSAACGLGLERRLAELRPAFEDGSPYHFGRLRALLARRRERDGHT